MTTKGTHRVTTHVTKPADVDLIARRARRTLELLEQRGERTFKLTREWSGHLRAAGGAPASGGAGAGTPPSSDDTDDGYSSPTERAALDPDPIGQMHTRYRAALALLADTLDEVEQIITTATANGGKAAQHRRNAEDRATFCVSCWRAGGREPRRGAKWCRWCEDMTRALAAEWTWEPGTAPPLTLVELHLEGKRITVRTVDDAMRKAGVRRRTVDELAQLEAQQ